MRNSIQRSYSVTLAQLKLRIRNILLFYKEGVMPCNFCMS